MKKLLLALALTALAPLAAHAQGGYEQYKANIANAENERMARESREASNSADAAARDALARQRAKYNRYDRNGNYIYGSNPNDTPYNTYPGPSLDKKKMARWRAYRDAYKADKARGKANNQAYKADQKAHDNTVSFPGGYRGIKGKGGGIITPEGKVIGEDNRKDRKYRESHPAANPSKAAVSTARQPAKQQPIPNKYPEIDPSNSLGKLQEFNRQEEARLKKQGKK